MIVGFTGTRRQLPHEQDAMLEVVVASLDASNTIVEGHHGDCIGADARFDHWCMVLGVERHAHPGPDGPYRAYCTSDVIYPQRPYLDRNRTIVDTCDMLIACPKGPEERRSGTWSTIRYARTIGRPVIYIWPDGVVEWPL